MNQEVCRMPDEIELVVKGAPFAFKALVTYEQSLYVAYCLELNLVATARTYRGAMDDLRAVVKTQVLYAIENDNMEYLYHSAPQEVWSDYFHLKGFTKSNTMEDK
jgi:hypothetical protein